MNWLELETVKAHALLGTELTYPCVTGPNIVKPKTIKHKIIGTYVRI